MEIIVSNHIELRNVPPTLARIIRECLTLENPKYAEAVKRGRWTGNLEKDLHFYQDTPGGLILPRGFVLQLLHMTTKAEISWRIIDQRRTLPSVDLTFTGKLRPYQAEATRNVLKHDFGCLSASTGSGKTTMALSVIAARKQPTLIIVHTKELLQQWIDRSCQFLDMAPEEIGVIGGGKKRIGDRLTIATVQSLYKIAGEISRNFGHIIIDECHHCPSRTFTEALSAFDSRFMLGLSATPYRGDKLSRLMYWSLGDKVHEVDKARLEKEGSILKPEVIIRNTGFVSEYDLTEEYAAGITELTENGPRNMLIVSDVVSYLQENNGPVMVLSDRKAHCEMLVKMLIDLGVNAEILIGDLPKAMREEAVDKIRAGKVQAICATGSLIGEGFDLPTASALFMGCPIKYKGKLIQYAGRVLRPAPGKKKALLYDYQDIYEPVLMAAARSRQRVYDESVQNAP